VLQVVESIAPYVTACIAILGAVLTTWLTHRNWLKQFVADRTFTLTEERRRRVREIPRKLFQGLLLAQRVLLSVALQNAFELLAAERSEALPGAAETHACLMEESAEALREHQAFMAELVMQPLLARLYFGEDAGRAVDAALNFLGAMKAGSELDVRMRTELLGQYKPCSSAAWTSRSCSPVARRS
jgi:hypothetical protein